MMQADKDEFSPVSTDSLATFHSGRGAATRRKNKAGKLPPGSGNMATKLVEEVQKDQAVVFATVKRRYCGTGAFDKHWLNMDCCGLVCALFTVALHAYGVYAVCVVLLPPWMSEDVLLEGQTSLTRQLTWTGTLHSAAFTAIAGLAVLSHFYAMTTDPGAVPPDAHPVEAPAENSDEVPLVATKAPPGLRLCRRCKAFKPKRAHHCSVCGRCIIKMDHHCPWVNNCVGIGNHKYFLLFIFYTFLSCAYSMTLIITRFSSCVQVHHRRHHRGHEDMMVATMAAAAVTPQNTCLDRPQQLLVILGLLIEALLFGMFTSCMMFDQMEVVKHKTTHIDRLKGLTVGGSLEGISEVFGVATSKTPDKAARFRMDWLSPVHRVCFPGNLREEVYGFCRPTQRETEMTTTPGSSNHKNGDGAKNGILGVAEIV